MKKDRFGNMKNRAVGGNFDLNFQASFAYKLKSALNFEGNLNSLRKSLSSAFFAVFFTANALVFVLFLTSCYSVYSGGVSGTVVNAESAANPKEGIANVDVYAYTEKSSRDSDYKKYNGEGAFKPSASYYGHTSTDSDGFFSLSRLVWKETKPDFGKDADSTTVYLLFYHENYGLTKGDTVIISDSTSDTVYAELTAIRKTTALNISFVDIATGNLTSNSVHVKVRVPQKNESHPDSNDKLYEAVFTGSGVLSVSYPRWKSESDKASGNEYTPEINVTYAQSADEVTWAACYNGDDDKNFSFRDDIDIKNGNGILKKISNSSFDLTFYGKSKRFSVPEISGSFGDVNSTASDGIKLFLKGYDEQASDFSLDFGSTFTQAQSLGTAGTEKHGYYTGLGGSAYSWEDASYTGKFSTKKLLIFDETESKSKEFEVSNEKSSYTITVE